MSFGLGSGAINFLEDPRDASTTSSQNALPFLPQDTPGPGSYEPIEPRVSRNKKSAAKRAAATPPKVAASPA